MKITFIFVIFGVALLFGILPAKIKSCGRNPRFMSMANAFSGGLFLAIALVHILPDVVHEYDEYLESQHNHTESLTNQVLFKFKGKQDLHGEGDEPEAFPLPFALVFAGYTFILLVDKVMFDSHALF
jgi:zinc transporter 1/2/3